MESNSLSEEEKIATRRKKIFFDFRGRGIKICPYNIDSIDYTKIHILVSMKITYEMSKEIIENITTADIFKIPGFLCTFIDKKKFEDGHEKASNCFVDTIVNPLSSIFAVFMFEHKIKENGEICLFFGGAPSALELKKEERANVNYMRNILETIFDDSKRFKCLETRYNLYDNFEFLYMDIDKHLQNITIRASKNGKQTNLVEKNFLNALRTKINNIKSANNISYFTNYEEDVLYNSYK